MLAKRMEEHKKDIAQARLSTSLAVEAYNRDLKIKWDETQIVRPLNVLTQATITESIEMLKRQKMENILNEKPAIHNQKRNLMLVMGTLYKKS